MCASNYICKDLPENADLQAIRQFGIFDKDGKRHQAGSVWDKNGLAPTLDTMQGGYRQPMIKDENMKEYVENALKKIKSYKMVGSRRVKMAQNIKVIQYIM